MGDYRNNIGLGILSICVLSLWIGVSAASANDVAGTPPAVVPSGANAEEASVSMPPMADPGQPTAAQPSAEDRAPSRPLTRAAARERIDRMSPRDWLANYGRVVVGRPD